MLQPFTAELSAMRIILASGSPRRKNVLANIGLKFDVVPSTFEENLDKSSFRVAADYAKETAKRKATEVAQRLLTKTDEKVLVVGADTIVTLGDQILEKPKDDGHAFEMLSLLSGKTHQVHTGVALITSKRHGQDPADADGPFQVTQFHETTEVRFSDLSPETIRGYIKTGEPLDKAGGYGIQELGGTLVSGVHGDYYNVVGFPLHSFCRQLVQLLSEERKQE